MTTIESPQPKDKVAILKRIPVFAACNDKQLALIADRTRLVEYKKGETIYQEGDAADAFYIVSSGRLRVFTRGGGAEKTFTVLHNGDSFGEISLLTGETHSATVQALNDTLVLRISKDDFEEVINRIPSLVLYLSRILSKRLRTRTQTEGALEASIIAIYSAAKGVGRTLFAVTLATQLLRETRRSTVIVDFCGSEEARMWLHGSSGLQAMALESLRTMAASEMFDAALSEHPLGFRVLCAGTLFSEEGGEGLIAPLLSALTKRFSYILVDLPVEVNTTVFKALMQSDIMYLVTDPNKPHVLQTGALIQQIQSAVGGAEQRIRIVLNRIEPLARQWSPADVAQQLGQPISLTLPYVPALSVPLSGEALARILEDSTSPYVAAARRAARQLGGLLVGLALGSGAALGLAHIGVLKVIEREKIPIDIIAGSSIGALIAGLWASGRSVDDLERMALRFKNPWDVRRLFILDVGIPFFGIVAGVVAGAVVWSLTGFWAGLFFGFFVCVALGLILGPLAGGPIQGAQLTAMLQADFQGKTFEETRLPLSIVAADPMNREEVVFTSGPLAEAVRASVSIPGIFKPVTRMGRICLDGGVVNPIPVSVLKRAGAHHIIAVNVFPTSAEITAHRQELERQRAERSAQMASRSFPIRLWEWLRQELRRSLSPLVFDVIMRAMQFMEHQIAEEACREADLTLRPTVPGSHWLEFFDPEKFIRRGEEVALEHLPELIHLTRPLDQHVDNPPQSQVG